MDLHLLGLGASRLLAEEAAGGEHQVKPVAVFVYLALTLVIVFGVLFLAVKNLKGRYPTHWAAQVFEQLYLFIEGVAVNVIGARGRRYTNFLMTLWLVIFTGNIVSLFFPMAPTANLGFNLGMALISIGYVQWEGMKQNGVFGHFRHFAGPKMPIVMLPIVLMLFCIEIISEIMKNLSLSLRLYGNIHGGHAAVEAINNLGKFNVGGHEIMIPLGAFLIPVKLLTCVVQALIFCLLTAVYISLVTHDSHDHDEAHAGHGEPAAAH